MSARSTTKWHTQTRAALPIFALLAAVGTCLVLTPKSGADSYSTETVTTPCCGKTTTVGRLQSEDYSQAQTDQDLAWESWALSYGLDTVNDRTGNQTKTYNCHSYCFRGSDGWLYSPNAYFGTTKGCWTPDSSGPVKSGTDAAHSCMVQDNEGKCGNRFRCKHNEKVYASQMPTTIYKQIP